jgi:excisionase family DNA binding protein
VVLQVLQKGRNVASDADNSLMDIMSVSVLTGLSVGTLYHWVSQQRIPVVRLSARCVRFRRSDIDAWISEKCVPPVDSDAEKKKSR